MTYAKDIKTTIGTGDLIEIYHMLNQTRLTGSLEHMSDAMDCIASHIDSNTTVPDGYDIKPSVSSLIAPSCEPGIIVDNDNKDIECAHHLPVSRAMSGGICQCNSLCPHFGIDCCPNNGSILLACGSTTGYTLQSELDRVSIL